MCKKFLKARIENISKVVGCKKFFREVFNVQKVFEVGNPDIFSNLRYTDILREKASGEEGKTTVNDSPTGPMRNASMSALERIKVRGETRKQFFMGLLVAARHHEGGAVGDEEKSRWE